MLSSTGALLIALTVANTGLGIVQGHIEADEPELVVVPPSTSCRVHFRVVNTGTTHLVVKDLRVSGDPAFITYGMMNPYPVQPGGGAGFNVEFHPKGPHRHDGWVVATIAYDPAAIQRAMEAKTQERRPAINKLISELAEIRLAGPDLKPLEIKKSKADSDWRAKDDELLGERRELWSEKYDLERAKEKALEELRQGRLCSDCGRAMSEFDSEAVFWAHIRSTAGRYAKPASQAQLDKKEAEFDAKIAAKARAMEQKDKQRESAKAAYERKLEELNQLKGKLEIAHERELAALAREIQRREEWLAKEIAEIRALEAKRGEISRELRGITRSEEP